MRGHPSTGAVARPTAAASTIRPSSHAAATAASNTRSSNTANLPSRSSHLSSAPSSSAFASTAAASSASSGPSTVPAPAHSISSRSARLEALRARKAALTADISSQQSILSSLDHEVCQLRLNILNEKDTFEQLQQHNRNETLKATLLQAFLSQRTSLVGVWKEYLHRIRVASGVSTTLAASASGGGVGDSGSKKEETFIDAEGHARTREQHALRQVLNLLEASFARTVARNPDGPIVSDEFEKLTPDSIDKSEILKALYEPRPSSSSSSSSQSIVSSDSSSTCPFHAASFLTNLITEVRSSREEIRQRIREVQEGRELETDKKKKDLNTQPKATVSETISSLIASLESESSTRFIQSQKLANETAAQQVVLDELKQKQRQGDTIILNAPLGSDVTLESKHHLVSIRRLQDLQLHLSSLRSQYQFATKTFETFQDIASKRQLAWNTFIEQRDSIATFPKIRKLRESSLIQHVLGHKGLRRKLREYEDRTWLEIRSKMVEGCESIKGYTAVLRGCMMMEVTNGLRILSYDSPFSRRDSSSSETSSKLEEVGPRIPIKRFVMNQIQTPSLQQVGLHSLLVDPFGSDGRDSNNSNFKGLRGKEMLVQITPTAIIMEVQRRIQRGQREGGGGGRIQT